MRREKQPPLGQVVITIEHHAYAMFSFLYSRSSFIFCGRSSEDRGGSIKGLGMAIKSRDRV